MEKANQETRRKHLKIIGAVGATCAFPFSAEELYAQQAGPALSPFEPQFFTAAEGRVIARMADLIIPETDTPGALAAGVPQYIDRVVMQDAEQQMRFRNGIRWLDDQANAQFGSSFVALNESQQVALLTPLSAPSMIASSAVLTQDQSVEFFHAVKNMTADGYYTSHAGLVEELGYAGNHALAGFTGCVHEH